MIEEAYVIYTNKITTNGSVGEFYYSEKGTPEGKWVSLIENATTFGCDCDADGKISVLPAGMYMIKKVLIKK